MRERTEFPKPPTSTGATSSYPRRWWYAEAIYEDAPGRLCVNRLNRDTKSECDLAVQSLKANFDRFARFQVDAFEVVVWAKDQRPTETCLTVTDPSDQAGALKAMGVLMERFGRRAKQLEIESEVF